MIENKTEYIKKHIKITYSLKSPYFKIILSPEDKIFKDLDNIQFWSKNETFIIASWETDEIKEELIPKICENFKKDKLFEMHKTFLKFLLYKKDNYDKFIWNIL